MTRTKAALLLACLCAFALPASASANTWPFEVSVKGQISESWQRSWTEQHDECSPRIEDSGGAIVRFETLKSQRVKANIDNGWLGNPQVRITSERHGSQTVSGRENFDGPSPVCDYTPESSGGPCGVKTFDSKLFLTYGSRPFDIGLVGEHDAWVPGSDCRYTPHPAAFDDYDDYGWDTLSVLDGAGPRLKVPYTMWIFNGRFKGRKVPARRQWTFHHSERVTMPYRRWKNGPVVGQYSADVEYTITFRRLGRIWRPPGY